MLWALTVVCSYPLLPQLAVQLHNAHEALESLGSSCDCLVITMGTSSVRPRDAFLLSFDTLPTDLPPTADPHISQTISNRAMRACLASWTHAINQHDEAGTVTLAAAPRACRTRVFARIPRPPIALPPSWIAVPPARTCQVAVTGSARGTIAELPFSAEAARRCHLVHLHVGNAATPVPSDPERWCWLQLSSPIRGLALR